MANDELVIISDQKSRQNKVLFFAICAILLFSVGLSAALDKIWVLVIPFIFLIVFATIVDLKLVFFLLFSTIAFSTEISFSNGFATDFPVEFFVIYLMFAYIAYVIYNVKNISSTFFRHPLSLLLVFHTLWIGVSCFHSHDLFVSVKFFLAKIWYVVTFYFLAGMMIKKLKDLKTDRKSVV